MSLPPHLPESRLTEELAARLPDATPAPPWSCRVRAVLWVQRAPSPLPSSSPFAGRVRGLAVGGLIDYLDSPVGPYREVLVGQLLRGSLLPVVHVPFIAVDSLASVHGGRTHWQLPKTVADFDGDTATGDGWTVRATARAYGLRFGVGGPIGNDQGSGRATTRLRGTARLARVDVTATGLTLTPWLGTGTRHGLVVEGRVTVGAPAPTRAPGVR